MRISCESVQLPSCCQAELKAVTESGGGLAAQKSVLEALLANVAARDEDAGDAGDGLLAALEGLKLGDPLPDAFPDL